MYNKLDFDSHSEYLMYWHLHQHIKVIQIIDVENVWKIVLWNTSTVKFKSEFIISNYYFHLLFPMLYNTEITRSVL